MIQVAQAQANEWLIPRLELITTIPSATYVVRAENPIERTKVWFMVEDDFTMTEYYRFTFTEKSISADGSQGEARLATPGNWIFTLFEGVAYAEDEAMLIEIWQERATVNPFTSH